MSWRVSPNLQALARSKFNAPDPEKVLCLTMSTAMVGVLPSSCTSLRRQLYNVVCLNAFGILSWSISAVITYHETENRPGGSNNK
jgi:hypothetical protein